MTNIAATSTLRRLLVASSRRRSSESLLCSPKTVGGVRHLGMRVAQGEPQYLPPHAMDAVKPPPYWKEHEPEDEDPNAEVRNPVSCAQMVDVPSGTLSETNVVTLKANGSVNHGIFGELDADLVEGIPLEYLAILGPSAEGAAALRTLSSDNKGTILVYGASEPAGLAAVQVGTADGHSVVAVVSGEQSGNEEMCDIVKGFTKEPGFMVPEEIAMIKATFRDLVMDSVTGMVEANAMQDSEQFLADFQQNLLDYIATYPDTLPAAVDANELVFEGKDKDRTYFRENMEAYLSQFPRGAPPISEQDLVEKFTKDQYAIWKAKFGVLFTKHISGDDVSDFNPPEAVKDMISYPEEMGKELTTQTPVPGAGEFIPYEFSVLHKPKTESATGEPIMGAIIAATPYLKNACEALENAKTLREKAEALQFLPIAERNAYAAASSVAALATNNGGKVLVVGGSLPGFESVEATKEDAVTAIQSMAIQDDGTSNLDHFIQVYRAGDYPIYADYAVHRATEVLAGPRQIIVTK